MSAWNREQVRNQLRTLGRVKSFLIVFFKTMSNTFMQGREKTFRGGSPPLLPL